jgi:predicted aspartyl protease
MVNFRNPATGRVTIEAKVSNQADRHLAEAGHLPPDQVRTMVLRGVVDTGAVMLVLPESAARQLGLTKTGETRVRYADHRTATREVVGDVEVEIGGRRSPFTAVVEPGRSEALYGAIVLEALDLIVDCGRQTLSPRDPDTMVTEIE